MGHRVSLSVTEPLFGVFFRSRGEFRGIDTGESGVSPPWDHLLALMPGTANSIGRIRQPAHRHPCRRSFHRCPRLLTVASDAIVAQANRVAPQNPPRD